jgi:hypothetical protein
MLAIDRRERLLHLSHVLAGCAVKRLVYDRLFGAAGASKRALQRLLGTQARVDLDDAVGTGQNADEGIIQFVSRRIFHGFLRNLYCLANWGEQIQVLDLDTNGGQAGRRRAVLADGGRLFHDGPPVVG